MDTAMQNLPKESTPVAQCVQSELESLQRLQDEISRLFKESQQQFAALLSPTTEFLPSHIQSLTTTSQVRSTKLMAALLYLYSDFSDKVFARIGELLDNERLSVNEKLLQIDSQLPIPKTTSAAKIAKALGVSKAAIIQTEWWRRFQTYKEHR